MKTNDMMPGFKIKQGVQYAIDLKGVSIVYPEKDMDLFLDYPEAAIWLVMAGQNRIKNTLKMLDAILGIEKAKTVDLINHCLENWKTAGLIE